MLKIYNESPVAVGSITSAFTSAAIDLKGSECWSLELVIANATPSAKVMGVATGNTFTMTAHGFATGLVGQCTTTGALPTGLSTSTNYFVIVVDANTIKLASSLANALAGTPITLSSAGTGTNTFTATALTAATALMQYSNNGTNWVVMPSPNGSTNITTTANFMFGDQAKPHYRYVQLVFAMTAGQLSVSTAFCAKQ